MSRAREAAVPAAPVALAVGDELPPFRTGPLTRTDFVRYAGAGGDLNPLHHDEELARAAGHPSVFGMGMFHAGLLGLRVARWVGPEQLRAFAVRFTGQVWPGDELTFGGRVERVAQTGAETVAELALAITRQNGDEVVRARATAAIAPTPEVRQL
jgi:acyl dehydratase